MNFDNEEIQEGSPPPVAEVQQEVNALNVPFPLGAIVRCAVQGRKAEMQLIGFVDESDNTSLRVKFLRRFSADVCFFPSVDHVTVERADNCVLLHKQPFC